MKTTKTNYLSMAALALLLSLGAAQDANAGVRVNATIRTPHVGIRVGNGPAGRYVGPRHKLLPARPYHQIKLSQSDRAIARRLGRYTGVPKRVLQELRRDGYRWVEIARWLDVPRPVLRAARHAKTWKRFLRHGGLEYGYDGDRRSGRRNHNRGNDRWDD